LFHHRTHATCDAARGIAASQGEERENIATSLNERFTVDEAGVVRGEAWAVLVLYGET
jgi:hypothetical protein